MNLINSLKADPKQGPVIISTIRPNIWKINSLGFNWKVLDYMYIQDLNVWAS